MQNSVSFGRRSGPLIDPAMVPIEELDSICQGTARWKILNRPSRFVDLRWAKGAP
jgi:hypothetical protein